MLDPSFRRHRSSVLREMPSARQKAARLRPFFQGTTNCLSALLAGVVLNSRAATPGSEYNSESVLDGSWEGAMFRPAALSLILACLTLLQPKWVSSAFGSPESVGVELARADSLTTAIERYLYQWNYVDAFDCAARQLRIRHRHLAIDDPRRAESHYWIGVVQRLTGQLERGSEQLAYALLLQRSAPKLQHRAMVATLLQLARVVRMRGEHARAETLVAEAQAIIGNELPNDDLMHADLLHTMGYLKWTKDHEPAVALGFYRDVLEIRTRELGETHPHTIDTMCWLAHVLIDIGDKDEAQRVLDRALVLAGQSQVEDIGVVGTILRVRAELFLAEGDLEKASQYFDRVDVAWRDLPLRSPLSYGLVRNVARRDLTLAAILLAQGQGNAAWETIERSNGWVTRLLQLAKRTEGDGHGLNALFDGAVRAERRMRELVRTASTEHAPSKRIDREAVRVECLSAEAVLAVALRDRARDDREDARSAATLARIQSSLTKREAIVGWLLPDRAAFPDPPPGGHALWAYVVRHEGAVRWVPLGAGTDGADASWSAVRNAAATGIRRAAQWPQLVRDDPVVKAKCHRWWRTCFAPIEPHLVGVDRLLTPSGELSGGLPIECLVDDAGRWLSDRYAIAYIPSATWYVQSISRGPRTGAIDQWTALVIGDPSYGRPTHDDVTDPLANLGAPHGDVLETTVIRSVLEGQGHSLDALPRLPMSRVEAKRVAAAFDRATLLLGDEANERRLETLKRNGDLARFDVVHVASHALMHIAQPELSAMALATTENNGDVFSAEDPLDGLVTTNEVRLGWVLDAELVVLSGCQTGRGGLRGSEGYLGFQQAMLAAGARSLIFSLWPVDDVATTLLMTRFYENVTGATGAALPKAEALREAKHWVRNFTDASGREPFAHPAYWAGFVLVGAPN